MVRNLILLTLTITQAQESVATEVQTILSSVGVDIKASEPIVLKLELVNKSENTVLYDKSIPDLYPLEILGSSGQEIKYKSYYRQWMGGPEKLLSKKKVYLYGQYDPRKNYNIKEPGRYTIRFRG